VGFALLFSFILSSDIQGMLRSGGGATRPGPVIVPKPKRVPAPVSVAVPAPFPFPAPAQEDGDGGKITLSTTEPGKSFYFRSDKPFKVAFKATSHGFVQASVYSEYNRTPLCTGTTDQRPSYLTGPHQVTFSQDTTYKIEIKPQFPELPVDAEAIIFDPLKGFPEGFRPSDLPIKKLHL
jgi:hypothetical protein